MFGSFGSENSQFNFPHGVAVTKQGRVIVADTGNSRIQVYN
jgi:DNA-binding beta-propeller fold protein YncE